MILKVNPLFTCNKSNSWLIFCMQYAWKGEKVSSEYTITYAEYPLHSLHKIHLSKLMSDQPNLLTVQQLVGNLKCSTPPCRQPYLEHRVAVSIGNVDLQTGKLGSIVVTEIKCFYSWKYKRETRIRIVLGTPEFDLQQLIGIIHTVKFAWFNKLWKTCRMALASTPYQVWSTWSPLVCMASECE